MMKLFHKVHVLNDEYDKSRKMTFWYTKMSKVN